MRVHILQVTKAVLAALIFSLVCVLIFSLIITFCSLSGAVIKPVNQVLKVIAVAFGGIIFIRGGRGLFKGVVYGAIAITVTYILYGLIASSLALTWWFALELALGAAAGGISGIIGVNIGK